MQNIRIIQCDKQLAICGEALGGGGALGVENPSDHTTTEQLFTN